MIGGNATRLGLVLAMVTPAFAAMEPGAHYYQAAREGAGLYERGDYAGAARLLRGLPRHADLLAEKSRRLEELDRRIAAERLREDASPRMTALIRERDGLVADFAVLRETTPYDRAAQIRLADAWARTGFLDGAVLLVRELLAAEPDPRLQAHLAEWLWATGRTVEAMERVRAAADQAAGDPELHEQIVLAGSRMAAAAKDADGGLSILAPLTSETARARSAALLFESGKFAEAAAAFAELEDDGSGLRLVNQARCLFAAGEYAKLRDLCRRHLESPIAAVAVECRFLEAVAIFALGDYEMAQGRLSRFLQDHPGSARAGAARLVRADVLIAMDRLAEAGALLDEIPAEATESAAAQLKLAEVMGLQGDAPGMRDALLLLAIAEEGNPIAAEAWFRLGLDQAELGDQAGAMESFLEKAEQYGNDPAAFGAEKMLRHLPRLFPTASGAQIEVRTETSRALGSMVERADQRGEETLAIRGLWANGLLFRDLNPTVSSFYFKAAASRIDLGRVSPSVLIDLADGLRRAGEIEAAERFYREILMTPGQILASGRARAGLGFLAAARGRDAEALAAFEEFTKSGADPEVLGEVLIAKAKLQEAQGNGEASASAWQEVLNSAEVRPPDRQMAAQALGDRSAETGDLPRAADYYRKAFESELGSPAVALAAGLKLGTALEKMRNPAQAMAVYRAAIGREDLKKLRQIESVRTRLAKLEEIKP